ncbi:MAG: TonB-dependent receptor [Acidobacteriota bacterium]|nr:TonB-dependent receptor [Acidobacteriota bacterium]
MRGTLSARCRALFGSALVAALALAPAALAQTDVTTSRVSGTVRDSEGGSPLPGVSVEARNQDTGLLQRTISRNDGFYQILNLPTGRYTLSANLSGFRTASRTDIRLDLGTAPTVDFRLQLSTVAESVTVTSAVPLVEVTNTAASTTIQTEQLKNLPLNGRDFKSLVLLTPETRFEAERGNLSISGQRGINTNVTVDGVDFNNAFFGGTVGAAEGRAPLSLSEESVKEFTVITNGASVEFGRSGGGFVNVITKSGTNNLHGSGFFYWQPKTLAEDFANGQKAADQDKKQYGASLGGPLLHDRLFFFGSYDRQDQNVTVPISTTVLDPDIFNRYPILQSSNAYVQTRNGYVAFGRLDLQASSAHRLMGRVNYAKYEGQNGTNSSANDTDTHNGLEGMKSTSVVGQYSGQFSSNFLNDLNLNYITEDTPRQDKGLNLPEIQLGGARYGEVAFLPIISTTKRKEISDTVTYLLQNHVFKAGGDYNDTSIDQIFKGNWRGVFVFNNKADLLAGRYFQYRQFGGLGGLTADEAGRAAFHQKELAFFLQDQWFVSPSFTVTAGVRWERLDNPNDPVLNPNDLDTSRCLAASTTSCGYRLTATIPDAKNQWSPRLGLSWAPDRKSVVRLSAGRFWSRTPAILFAQLFTSNGLRGTQYNTFTNTAGQDPTDPNCRAGTRSCYDPLAPGWGPAFNPAGVQRIDFTRVAAPTGLGVFAIDPNFKDPYTDRITLGFEREVLTGVGASIDGTYAEAKQLQRLTDRNRVYANPPANAANGLPLYSSSRPNPYYGRITTSVSDAKSKYYAVTGNLQRRFANSFSAGANVTYSVDRDNDSNERNFAGIQAEDFNNLDLNYGYSNRDQRWKFSANAVWQTPFWGIGAAGSARYSSGQPYTGRANFDFNNDAESSTDRPTVNGVHFDRNSFRQPRFFSLDLRLSKAFQLGPGDLSAAVECFNCTNVANWSVPSSNQTWGPGETPLATFGRATTPGTPRTIQVSARYDF